MRGRWSWGTERRQARLREVETETQRESRREALICPTTPSLTLCRAPEAPTLQSPVLSPSHVSLSVSPDSDSKQVRGKGPVEDLLPTWENPQRHPAPASVSRIKGHWEVRVDVAARQKRGCSPPQSTQVWPGRELPFALGAQCTR